MCGYYADYQSVITITETPVSVLQFQFLILIIAGWVNRTQQDVIEYLEAENRDRKNRYC